MPEAWDDNKRRRDEEKFDELHEEGRTSRYDICLCTDESYVGCPKHDPFYHDRSKR